MVGPLKEAKAAGGPICCKLFGVLQGFWMDCGTPLDAFRMTFGSFFDPRAGAAWQRSVSFNF